MLWCHPHCMAVACCDWKGVCQGSLWLLPDPVLSLTTDPCFHQIPCTLTAVPRACEVTVWKLYSFSFPDLKSSGIMTPGASDLAM